MMSDPVNTGGGGMWFHDVRLPFAFALLMLDFNWICACSNGYE